MQSLWKSLLGAGSQSSEDALLGAIPLFDDLSPREIDAIQRLLHRRDYVAGESVFVEGEPGLGMYIISRGVVSIQSEPSGRELVELTDGDFFGEIALLNEVIRTATARAKTDCHLLSLFQPDLLSLLDRNPRLGVKVLLSLSRLVGLRLVEVSDEVEDLTRECEQLRAAAGGAAATGGAAGGAAGGAPAAGGAAMAEPQPRRPLRVDETPARPGTRPSRLSTWAGLAAVVSLGLVLAAAPDLAGLVVFAAALAYLLVPVVNALERRGVGRTAGTVLVLVVLTAALVSTVVLAVPVVFEQLTSLQERWESGELLALVADVEARLAARLSVVDADQLGLVRSVREAAAPAGGSLMGYVPTMLETLGTSVVVPFVLFALLKDGPVLRRRVLRVVPNRYFEFAMNVAYKADAHLGGYLRGQALIALLVGTSTALGLGLLGVDYYLVLGVVTGLANFVPYAGFVVSAGLSVVVSIVTTGGTGQVVPVVLLYAGLQTVENVVFQPWITGKNVAMHPALVLIAILVGGRVAGVFGMALAVPTAAILKVFLVETAVSLRRYNL